MNNPTTQSILYITATPIGNLNDITFRAIQLLKDTSLIICEDSRRIKKILSSYDITFKNKIFFTYNDYNKNKIINKLIETILLHKYAVLVSDAGTPAISDPGYVLINACKDNNIKTVPIPGVSAITTLLSASGIPTDKFIFLGFFPKKKSRQIELINKIKYLNSTIIFFERGSRLNKTLENIKDIIGNCQIVIGRELTKKFETIYNTNINDFLLQYKNDSAIIKGEHTICLYDLEISDEKTVDKYIELYNRIKNITDINKSELIKIICNTFKLNKNKFYRTV